MDDLAVDGGGHADGRRHDAQPAEPAAAARPRSMRSWSMPPWRMQFLRRLSDGMEEAKS